MKIIISLVLALFIMNNICSQEKNSIIEVGDTIKPLKGSYYFLHSFPENFSPQFEVTSRANVGIKKEDRTSALRASWS